MLNIAHMVVIKPQSGTHVAPIDLKLMEMEQFARFTLEKEILNRIRGRLTAEQEVAYRLNLESYRQLERDPSAENRETRMLDLDNAFHRRAFELCGMEEHFDHMLSTFQHIERLRKFSLQTEENKSVCAAHTRILEAVLRGSEEDLSRALSDHLNRYKLSVEQARQRHPEYFTEGTVGLIDNVR
jgi:transcriptional regulator